MSSHRCEKSARALARGQFSPLLNPPPQAGKRRKGRPPLANGEHALEAMQWVQQLYEAGVLPVREIGRLAGVTERMIYKYARVGGWLRRRGSVASATPAATYRVAKACVGAARKARADLDKAKAEADMCAARIEAKREREARYDVFDAVNEALLELIAWVADTNGNPALRARTEPLQHRVMDGIERMQLSSLAPRTLSPRAGRVGCETVRVRGRGRESEQ
jgi:hypothetical protein